MSTSLPAYVKETTNIVTARGSLLFVKAIPGIKYGEIVEIDLEGESRYGQVIDVSRDVAIIQVFGGTSAITPGRTLIRFRGETLKLPVSLDMLGRVFDGLGRPIDGGPSIVPEDYLDIHGAPLNPASRVPPSEFIETGVSAIDGLLTLVRGQKLPIFSGSGLPHNRLAMQIVRQATVKGTGEKFAVVFGAIGVTYEESSFFIESLRRMGALERTIAFITTASAPTVEKLALPRVALTAAEFLAWRYDMHVLTILTDMTNYCFHKDTELLSYDGSIIKIGEFVEQTEKNSSEEFIPLSTGQGLALMKWSKISQPLRIVSWNDLQTQIGKVIAIEKIKAPRKIIRIRTRSGAELLVTEDHKLLVDTLKGSLFIPASKIKKGMDLYSIRELTIYPEKIPSLIELLLPRSEEFYIHMRSDILERRLREKFGSLKRACEILGLEYRHIVDSKTKRYFHPHELIRISTYLGISIDDIHNHIDYITANGKERIRLAKPRVSKELCQVLGWILSDGTIYESPEKGIYYISFNNKNEKLIKSFIRKLKNLFPGVNIRLNMNENGTLIARADSKVITQIFKELSRLDQDKELEPLIKLPKDYISMFLSGYIDGDGSIFVDRVKIQITTKNRIRAKRLQLLLKRLGIQSTITQRTSGFCVNKVYDVIISGKEDVVKLIKLLRLEHPEKLHRLKELIESLDNMRYRASKFYLAPRICSRLLRAIRHRYGIDAKELGSVSTISQFENFRRRVSRSLLELWVKRLERRIDQNDPDYQMLRKLIYGNYVLDEVIEVTYLENPSEYVYDITVVPNHVLIVENGIISSNCEALREISAAREEVPGRRGYPGYMYSVDGSRRVVVIDDKGILRVLRIRDLFEIAKKINGIEPQGDVQRLALPGWKALGVTKDGKVVFRNIKAIIRHRYHGPMVRITTIAGETIVTPNHSVFTIRGGSIVPIEASKLKEGDLIVQVDRFNYEKEVFIETPKGPIELSEEIAKFLGAYVAEGHCTKAYDRKFNRVRYYVAIDNKSTDYLEQAAGGLRSLGTKYDTLHVHDKRSGSLRLAIQRKWLYDFLVDNCGRIAHTKRVPDIILSAPMSIKKAFFDSYYNGDGKSSDPRYRIDQYYMVTISEDLRDTLIVLCKMLFPDRIPTIYKWRDRNAWRLYLSTYLRCKNIKLNDVRAVEITKVEFVEPSEEWVYDLSVEDIENFVDACGCVLLHNTDLATMYERAGRVHNKKGSMTIMPVLTMPDDDITHPIPDLTGYITEGQIVLSRELSRKRIYPPIDVFLSLSRLMKEGIGPGKTREDHREVFAQLFAAYAEGQYLRELSLIVGAESLTDRDKKYLAFADEFEKRFISQGEFERRTIEETLDLAWDLLAMLPEEELKQISEPTLKKYHPKYRKSQQQSSR